MACGSANSTSCGELDVVTWLAGRTRRCGCAGCRAIFMELLYRVRGAEACEGLALVAVARVGLAGVIGVGVIREGVRRWTGPVS